MVADKQDKFLNVPTQGKVPHLRFPEFKNEWAALSMEDCLMRLENGANYDTNDVEGYPMSRIETISKSHIDYSKVGHSANLKNAEHYRMLYGDILFSHINSVRHIGKTAYYEAEKPLYHGMNLLLLRCKQEMDSKFIYYLLNNQQFLRKCQVLAKQAVNQASISTSDLRKIGLYVPQHDEQIRIAKFLSCIDERISTQIRIIEELKMFRDTLMFKLLSPRKNWEHVCIHDVAMVVGGGTPDTNVKEYWDGNIQWFTPSEIGKEKYVIASEKTISQAGLDNSSAKLLPANTILLSTRATIGECSIAKKECCTNQGFQSLVATTVTPEFLYYLIQTKKRDLLSKASGSTFSEISANEVRKIHICIPTTAKEQEALVQPLSAYDEKIETECKILYLYKLQKQFLLSKLFI